MHRTQFRERVSDHSVALAASCSSDSKGISPTLCQHNIYMEPNANPIVDHQRCLNPKMKEVVRTEILKLLDAGIIYPTVDS